MCQQATVSLRRDELSLVIQKMFAIYINTLCHYRNSSVPTVAANGKLGLLDLILLEQIALMSGNTIAGHIAKQILTRILFCDVIEGIYYLSKGSLAAIQASINSGCMSTRVCSTYDCKTGDTQCYDSLVVKGLCENLGA